VAQAVGKDGWINTNIQHVHGGQLDNRVEEGKSHDDRNGLDHLCTDIGYQGDSGRVQQAEAKHRKLTIKYHALQQTKIRANNRKAQPTFGSPFSNPNIRRQLALDCHLATSSHCFDKAGVNSAVLFMPSRPIGSANPLKLVFFHSHN
jgi:hypothetical protein